MKKECIGQLVKEAEIARQGAWWDKKIGHWRMGTIIFDGNDLYLYQKDRVFGKINRYHIYEIGMDSKAIGFKNKDVIKINVWINNIWITHYYCSSDLDSMIKLLKGIVVQGISKEILLKFSKKLDEGSQNIIQFLIRVGHAPIETIRKNCQYETHHEVLHCVRDIINSEAASEFGFPILRFEKYRKDEINNKMINYEWWLVKSKSFNRPKVYWDIIEEKKHIILLIDLKEVEEEKYHISDDGKNIVLKFMINRKYHEELIPLDFSIACKPFDVRETMKILQMKFYKNRSSIYERTEAEG